MNEADPRRSREDAALRAIVEGVESETGEKFFRSLVRHVASALDVAYAFVSEFTEDRAHFRTLAVWGRGEPIENFTIPIRGTPCEAVLNGRMSHHPERLQALFPEDRGLQRWRAESYCGVPLLDSSGAVVGHLAIMDDRPMNDGPRGLAILRIFAARARAEVERLRLERRLRDGEARYRDLFDEAPVAYVIVDRDARILDGNRGMREMLGFGPGGIAGRSLFELDAGGEPERLRARFEPFLAGRAPLAGEARELRRADGSAFWARVWGRALRDAEGRAEVSRLALVDVTEERRARETAGRLDRQNRYLQEEIRSVHHFDEIVGESRRLREVLETVALVARTDATVLVLGETGTGKELVARAIHSASPRRDRPLVKVSCAALPAGLIESELFGHVKGAFTGATEKRIGRFELADGGTIFLDEVGELPPETQVKLLRVLQERELEPVGSSRTVRVDVRVIAATNRELARAVAEGAFRGDLYYRLNVFPVSLPPLRERREDIPPLVHYFVARTAAKTGRRIASVPPEAMARLESYDWPGNVRELENVIERAVILSPGAELEVPPQMLRPVGSAPVPAPEPAADAPRDAQALSLEEVERRHIRRILERTGWRIEGPEGAARVLRIHPNTLRSRMDRLGIRRAAKPAVGEPA